MFEDLLLSRQARDEQSREAQDVVNVDVAEKNAEGVAENDDEGDETPQATDEQSGKHNSDTVDIVENSCSSDVSTEFPVATCQSFFPNTHLLHWLIVAKSMLSHQ